MTTEQCTREHLELHGYEDITLDDTTFENAWNDGGLCLADGCYRPKNCQALQTVAIIIPYKNRAQQLTNLLSKLHPFLQRQALDYCIFVAEQFDDGSFNKGAIMNAAFIEASKVRNFDCFIFHDVDLIPEDDRNMYLCNSESPIHLSALIDKFKYKLHYGTDFGGVTAMSHEQYIKANGYSNLFYGWGREDSDMEYRISAAGMQTIKPTPIDYSKYKMMLHFHPWRFQNEKFQIATKSHKHEGVSPLSPKEKLMVTKEVRQPWDGVMNTKYRIKAFNRNKLFSHLKLDIRKLKFNKLSLFIDDENLYNFDVSDSVQTQGIEEKPMNCKYLELNDTFLSARWAIFKGSSAKDHHMLTKQLSKSQAFQICDEIGELCGGITEEVEISGPNRFSIREKAIPVTSDGPKKAVSYVKQCESTL